jgi:cyanate permease
VRWLKKKQRRLEVWLGPSWLGALDSLASAVFLTVACGLVFWPISPGEPSAELFWHLAEIGGAIFLAFSIGLVGLGHRLATPSHRNWLAGVCMSGGLGLSAIGVSLALAASREAHHSTSFDLWGLYWVIANLTIMGFLVALLPIIAASWREPEVED